MTILLGLVNFPATAQVPAPNLARNLFDKMVGELRPGEESAARRLLQISSLQQMRTLPNPELQMGFGRTRFGSFEGNYQEIILGQTLPLNEVRSGNQNKIDLTQRLSEIEAKEIQFAAEREALLYLFGHQRNLEFASHIQERMGRLSLVEEFLNKRKFASPRDQLDREQLRYRIKLLRAELAEVKAQLNLSTYFFEIYENPQQVSQLRISWPSQDQFTSLLASLEGKDLGLFSEQLSLNSRLVLQDQKIAESLWRPDLKIYLMQTYEGQPFQAAQINEALGVAIQLPLFDRGQYQRDQAQSQVFELQIQHIKNQRRRSFQALALREEFLKLQKIIGRTPIKKVGEEDRIMTLATRQFQKGLIPIHQFLDLDEQIHADLHMRVQAQFDLVRVSLDLMNENKNYLEVKEIFL